MVKKKQEIKTKSIELNVLPLKDLVFFPHMVVERCMLEDKILLMVTQRDAAKEDIAPRDLFRVGVTGRVLQIIKLPNGLVKILVEGISRAKVIRFINKKQYLASVIDVSVEVIEVNDEMEAKKRHLLAMFKEYIKMNEEVPEEILFTLNQDDEVSKLTDFIATYLEIKF